MQQPTPGHFRIAFALVCLSIALLYVAYGRQGVLRRDDANLMYAAQGVVRGTPPYQSIFNMTGPVPPLVAGSGCLLARVLGLDDLHTTRTVFGALSLLAALLLYRLACDMGLRGMASAAGAWALAAYPEFARCSLNGPQKKAVMVLMVVAALLAFHRKRWAVSGAAGILAGLSWQGAFGVTLACLAGVGAHGLRPTLRFCLGAAAAAACISSYYVWTGSFREMVDGTFTMALYHPLNSADAPSRLWRIFRILPAWQSALYLAGGLTLACTLILLPRQTKPRRKALADIRVVSASAMLLLLGISLRDFQSTPDFFVLLPFFGLGWALALDRAARVTPRLTLLLTLSIACAALLHANTTRDQVLPIQKRHAASLLARYGNDATFRVVGAPEWLVLTHRTQNDAFVFIIGGIDTYIEARRPGGFGAWLDELKKESPDVIMAGPTHGALMQPYFDWLHGSYDARPLGTWTVHTKKPDAGAHVR